MEYRERPRARAKNCVFCVLSSISLLNSQAYRDELGEEEGARSAYFLGAGLTPSSGTRGYSLYEKSWPAKSVEEGVGGHKALHRLQQLNSYGRLEKVTIDFRDPPPPYPTSNNQLFVSKALTSTSIVSCF